MKACGPHIRCQADHKGASLFGFGVSRIGMAEMQRRLRDGDPVIIDVREPSEFAEGHVPGARNLPLGSLPGAASGLDPHVETLVICRSGHRSVTATRILKKSGFTDVHSVNGGTLAWPGTLER